MKPPPWVPGFGFDQAAIRGIPVASLTAPTSLTAIVEEFGSFRTASIETKAMLDTARQVADFPVAVLIQGETGTGKELIARALHAHSSRRDAPFVAVNCGAIAENLVESELFGHRKGAFTGASSDREGIFESAAGGTVFLDEIVDLPLPTQVKLLRVLQEGEVRRVGDSRTRQVDVRIISAAAAALTDRIEAGSFREDLFFRLAVITLRIPPLRRRPEDIAALADHFLDRATSVMGVEVSGITSAAMDALLSYRWPGNVRELENAFQRGAILAHGGDLDATHLGLQIQQSQSLIRALSMTEEVTLSEATARLERTLIAHALRRSENSRTEAAKQLGVSRRTLQYKLKEHFPGGFD